MKLGVLYSAVLLIVSSFFIALAPTGASRVSALPASSCSFDIYYTIDLSSSMKSALESGGGSKLDVAKATIANVNTQIAANNPGSRFGYTSFYTSETPGPDPAKPYPGVTASKPLTGNAFSINQDIDRLQARGATPLPKGIKDSVAAMNNTTTGWNRQNIPVMILLSDGVPTIDSENYPYMPDKVSDVEIKNANGTFKAPAEVALLGDFSHQTYPNTPYKAGRVLADAMSQALTIDGIQNNGGQSEQVKTAGIFLRGVDFSVQRDNPDIVEYFGSINGNNFFTPTSSSQLLSSINTLLENSCDEDPPTESGKVIVNLPPKSIYTPEQMLLEGHTFNFASGQFSPRVHPDQFIKVDTFTEKTGTDLESYRIEISGIRRGEAVAVNRFNRLIGAISAKAYSPPPATNVLLLGPPIYDIKMTFAGEATTSTLGQISSQLGSYEYAFLGDSSCGTSTNPTHMCFRTKTSAVGFPGSADGSLYIIDAVEMDFPGTITVEGNVLASENIGGFVFPSSGGNQDWIAVGGTVEAGVSGEDSQRLNNYVAGNAKLEWGSIDDTGSIAYKLSQKKDEGIDIATVFPADSNQTTTTFDGGNFNLNAPGTNPRAAGQSSFSSGPDGKVWYNGDSNSSVTLNSVNVTGVGTLIVKGNLVVNGSLTCSSGTSFGVIATGSVIFNTGDISCGSYTALGEVNQGNITFDTNVGQSAIATGIFIAKGDITLPSVSPGNDYTLKYDTSFAEDPSALFRDILGIVFSTSS